MKGSTRMELRQLRYFVSIVDLGSFTKAAGSPIHYTANIQLEYPKIRGRIWCNVIGQTL